jgi:hypothetical protein
MVQVCKSQKDCVRKSKIHRVRHLRKICKTNKLFQSANLLISYLRNLLADRPPLTITVTSQDIFYFFHKIVLVTTVLTSYAGKSENHSLLRYLNAKK